MVRITAEAFAQLPVPEGEDFELLEGELIPLPGATPRHSCKRATFIVLLLDYFRHSTLGFSLSSVDCLLNQTTVLRPDVSIFLNPSSKRIDMDVVPVPFAPNIAIEILSNSESAIQVNSKLRHYLSAGTQEIWVVDSANAELFIHTPTSIRLLEGEAILETPLLPGFRASISEILGPPVPLA